jgi:hypothetical protein
MLFVENPNPLRPVGLVNIFYGNISDVLGDTNDLTEISKYATT